MYYFNLSEERQKVVDNFIDLIMKEEDPKQIKKPLLPYNKTKTASIIPDYGTTTSHLDYIIFGNL